MLQDAGGARRDSEPKEIAMNPLTTLTATVDFDRDPADWWPR